MTKSQWKEGAIEGDVVACNPYFVAVCEAVAKVFVVPIYADENSWFRGEVKTLIVERAAISE